MTTPADEKKLMMRVTNVGIRYRQKISFMKSSDFWAIKDVSFDIRKGETLGVIGRNGAGKSSLLRVLAGITDADHGTVESFDHSVSLLGLLLGFNQNLSGRDNAIINGMLQGLDRKEIESRLDELLKFSELGEFFYQPVKNYSSGMQARLRFAVAIQVNPDILLIDELLGVGDASFKKKSSQIIKSRIKQGQTAVIVSHDMTTLKELCDRAVWIDNGVTRMVGTAEDVFHEYEKSQS